MEALAPVLQLQPARHRHGRLVEAEGFGNPQGCGALQRGDPSAIAILPMGLLHPVLQLGRTQKKAARMGIQGGFEQQLSAGPLGGQGGSRLGHHKAPIVLCHGPIDEEPIHRMGLAMEFDAMGQQQAIVANLTAEPIDLAEKPGIVNHQVVFQVAVEVVTLIEPASEETLGLKPQVPGGGWLRDHHLEEMAVGRGQPIEDVVLPIGDHLDLDLVLKLLVGGLGLHRRHVELGLAHAQPLERQQLLLERLNARPRILPQRTMGPAAFGIPVVDDGQQDSHQHPHLWPRIPC